MKFAVLSKLIGISAIGAIALFPLPAHAQFLSIPVTNGSFAVQGTGGGTIYSRPITLLSPAGSINLTSVPLPASANTPIITVNTPTGLYFWDVAGTANLNDGRSANFLGGQGYLKLEALGTVSGAATSPLLPTAAGVTVDYTIQAGSLTIPQNTVSGYTTPQVAIPVSGGTFVINTPATAQADTITIAGLLTPAGSANVTLTLPDLSQRTAQDLLLTGANQPVLLYGVANGSLPLADGQVASVNNQLITFAATARVTTGNSLWYGEEIPAIATVIQGAIAGGSISVPTSAITAVQPPNPFPIPPSGEQPPVTNPPITNPPITNPPVLDPPVSTPPLGNPQPPLGINPPTPVRPEPVLQASSSLLPLASPQAAPDLVALRPEPVLQSPAASEPPPLVVGFTAGLDLNDDLYRIVRERQAIARDIPEVEQSSLEYSRIHPLVNVYNR